MPAIGSSACDTTAPEAVVVTSVAPGPAEGVSVDVTRASSASLKQGLLNGSNDYYEPTPEFDRADALLSALRPTAWRFSGFGNAGYGGHIYDFVVRDYRYDARFGTSVVVNLQDMVTVRHGIPLEVREDCDSSRCFASFEALRAAFNAAIADFFAANPSPAVSYFDLLAEADFGVYRGVAPEQIYLLLVDALAQVEMHAPYAKVVGPSNGAFDRNIYATLVELLIRDGLRLDAISWHELDSDPAAVAEHVAQMQQIFDEHPAICEPSCPEIHINEYQSEDTVFIPGHAIGWLAALEGARVDQANRSCWGGDPGSPIPYESCWYGFSGFLTEDNATPQPIYWVYERYAALRTRFATASTLPHVSAVAGALDDGSHGVLVASLCHDHAGAEVRLSGVDFDAAIVDVYRIPNTFNGNRPMPRLDAMQSLPAVATEGTLSLRFDALPAGDAFWLHVRPQ